VRGFPSCTSVPQGLLDVAVSPSALSIVVAGEGIAETATLLLHNVVVYVSIYVKPPFRLFGTVVFTAHQETVHAADCHVGRCHQGAATAEAGDNALSTNLVVCVHHRACCCSGLLENGITRTRHYCKDITRGFVCVPQPTCALHSPVSLLIRYASFSKQHSIIVAHPRLSVKQLVSLAASGHTTASCFNMKANVAQLLFGCLLAGCLAATAAADCLPGDLPCFCTQLGGEWRPVKAPLKPVCTYKFQQSVNGKGERAGMCCCQL
jgi:hypothetical protein